MKLKLVSSKICPFVQRAVILLRAKNAPYDVAYVDLANKPEWFVRTSPRGKVPLLIVDGTVLFESQAICEYLDETMGDARLAPEDPLQRARDRAWFPFSGEDLFGAQFRAMIATEPAAQQAAAKQLQEHLGRLAQELSGEYLSGEGSRFGLADVAVAPTFTRLRVLENHFGVDWLPRLASLRGYAERLLQLPCVEESVPEDFEAALLAFLEKRGSALLKSTS